MNLTNSRAIRVLFLVALVATLSACRVKDDLYNTPHPGMGAVSVIIGGEAREMAYIAHAGEIAGTVTGGEGTLPGLFAPGEYTLSVHNAPRGFTFSGTLARVERLADGTLAPLPGELFSAMTGIEVAADDTLRVPVIPARRTRRLTLRLTARGNDPAIIASVEATLGGIAPAVDAASNTLAGEPAVVRPLFTRDNALLTAELNLTGVVTGSRQRLVVTITATDGQRQSLEADLTALLASFNEGTTPLVLDAGLQLMTDASFDFAITGWEETLPGEGEAV